MKGKDILSITLVVVILLLTGCTPKITEDEYQNLESQIHFKMKDIISYVEMNIPISDNEESREVIINHIETVEKDLADIFKQSKNKIPKSKKLEFESIKTTAEGGILLITSYLKYGYEPSTKKKLDDILTDWKDVTDYDDELDNIWINNPEVKKTFKDSVEEYRKEFNLDITWKDIQYDMYNNLSKEFLVAGTAELSDYYNYGFREREKNYFCVSIIPYDGDYTNRWHLYFNREDFKELFDSLKEEKRVIITTCEIPDYIYKEGQGNMAFVNQVRW